MLGNVKVLVKGQKGQKKSKKTLSNIYKTEKKWNKTVIKTKTKIVRKISKKLLLTQP